MKNIKYEKELKVSISAAKMAGNTIIKYFKSRERVIRKSIKELVTKSDIEAQTIIINILSKEFPNYDIFCEEKLKQDFSSKPTWVVDPIDGTHNFISGIPFFGISIGLIENLNFQLGVIYFPLETKVFTAIKGQGAFCNNKKISVSSNRHLSKALITYDNQFYLSPNAFNYYKKLIDKAFTTRILGSATKDFCFIAEGVIDGRIWNNTKLCDIAAGVVILEEAGGKATDFLGHKINIHTKQVVASNGFIHDQLLSTVMEDLND